MSKNILITEIDEKAVERLIGDLSKADSGKGAIYVYLHSKGGDVDAGFAMYDLLRMTRNPVVTVGMGVVGSMAVLLLQAGDWRVVTENTSVLIHPGSIAIRGDLMASKSHMDETIRQHEKYCLLIGKRIGNDAFIAKAASAETYVEGKALVDLNLVDEIATLRPFAASSPKKTRKKKTSGTNKRN